MANAVVALVAKAVAWVAANWVTAAAMAALAIDAALTKRNLGSYSSDADLRRESVIRSATEPRNIVYGKTLVGGVLTYMNPAGASNEDMWMVVAHAGHEVEDITDIYIYDDYVGSANISWGGGVTGGEYYIGSTSYLSLYKNLGGSAQTALTDLVNAFADFTTNHRGRGVAYAAAKLTLEVESETVYEAGAPTKYQALITGKNDIYDPRLDTSPGANPANASYQAYSTNPILQAANYLTDTRLGPGFSTSKINWQVVADEANYCDVQVPTSTADTTEKRFVSNVMLITTNIYRDNLQDILSACNGRFSYRGGKFNIRAGRFGQGANLATNPTFGSDVTGWSAGVNGGVQGITTVVGNVYTVRVTVKSSGNESNLYQLAKSDNSNGSAPSVTDSCTAPDKSLYVSFVATATTSYICLNNTAAALSTLTHSASNGGQCLVTATDTTTAAFDDVEVYLVSSTSIDESWLAGDLSVITATPKNERFNSAKGFYVSAAENYKKIEALEVTNPAFVTRDDAQKLYETFTFPCTTHEDGAQRLMFKRIQQTDEQKVLRMPCNYKALKVAVHDYAHVTISELSWPNKVFRIIDWRLEPSDNGITLVLKEDSAAGYKDPDLSDYSTRTASGGITLADPVAGFNNDRDASAIDPPYYTAPTTAVSVSPAGAIAITSDGTNWTVPETTVASAAAGGSLGRMVVVGSGSIKIRYSDDLGATWNTATGDVAQNWQGVAWTGEVGSATLGRFCACGNNVISYSDDGGATWTAGTSPAASDWYDVAANTAGTFCIVSAANQKTATGDGADSWTLADFDLNNQDPYYGASASGQLTNSGVTFIGTGDSAGERLWYGNGRDWTILPNDTALGPTPPAVTGSEIDTIVGGASDAVAIDGIILVCGNLSYIARSAAVATVPYNSVAISSGKSSLGYMSDRDRVIATGGNGTAIYSDDKGATWSNAAAPPSVSWPTKTFQGIGVASLYAAITHIINTAGDADIKVEWAWDGTEADIDGFIVRIYSATTDDGYAIGDTPTLEQTYIVPRDQRMFILYSVAADRFYTFGVQAYRTVDSDVDADGEIRSTVWEPDQNAYQPSTSVEFSGDFTGTINGNDSNDVVFSDSGSFTGTLTGMVSNPSGTVNWAKVGSFATLSIPSELSDTSNAATMTLTTLPATLYPAYDRTVQIYGVIVVGGNIVAGTVTVSTAGSVTFKRLTWDGTDLLQSPFSTSGAKGLEAGFNFTYRLD